MATRVPSSRLEEVSGRVLGASWSPKMGVSPALRAIFWILTIVGKIRVVKARSETKTPQILEIAFRLGVVPVFGHACPIKQA